MNVVAVVALACDDEDELVSVVGETRVSLSAGIWFHTLPRDRKQFLLVVHRQNSEVTRLVFDLKQLVATHLARDVFEVSKIWISMAIVRPEFTSVSTECNHLLLHGLSGDVFGEEEHLSQGKACLHSAHTHVVPPLVEPLHSVLLEARQKTESDSHGAIRLDNARAPLLCRVSLESFLLAKLAKLVCQDQASFHLIG